MTIAITFDPNAQLFHLTNGQISYLIEVIDKTYLAHRYFGQALPSFAKADQVPLRKRTFAAGPKLEQPEFSLACLRQEYPLPMQGDQRTSAIEFATTELNTIVRFKYDSYQVSEQAPELVALPHARNHKDKPAKTLIITLKDEHLDLKLELYYTLFEDLAAVVRSTKLTNLGSSPICVKKLASASLDLNFADQELYTFWGSHQSEFQLQKTPLIHGSFISESTSGASGPEYVPFLALGKEANEHRGEVVATSLIYSGDHQELCERDQYDTVRLQIQMTAHDFSWTLAKNESLQTPQALLVHSLQGFNGMSKTFYQFEKDHLIAPHFATKTRPILINSWEMSYFEVNEQRMLAVIDQAKRLGFEAVVLDDGWFDGRNSSQSSLGDWTVDRKKFPNGLTPLIKAAKQKNLLFGIWFEPEMISPKSKLIQKHPTWVVRSADHEPFYSRNQLVLDLTQKAVQDFIIDTLSQFIKKYQVDYIKWDMNRHLVEKISQVTTDSHQDFSHRYMLGLYRIIDILTKRFSDVLFENCSSGGGRLDLGMLYYFPQTWASDNTDALDRQQIQYGASYLFYPYYLTGHVSATPNHQTRRNSALKTRMDLASSVNMGYELDILDLPSNQAELIIKHNETYRRERSLLINGDFYRLTNDRLVSWMFVDQTKDTALVTAFKARYRVTDEHHILQIPYLAEEKYYHIEELELVVSGAELKYSGVHLPFSPHDLSSYRLHLKSI